MEADTLGFSIEEIPQKISRKPSLSVYISKQVLHKFRIEPRNGISYAGPLILQGEEPGSLIFKESRPGI